MLPRILSVWRAAQARAKSYRKEEDGSLIVFSIFVFIVMLMFGGIAVDLMLYENRRTHIQNSTDRAVLAAANLNQSVDPKTVVQDYLAKVGINISLDDVDVREIGAMPVITGRQVSVNVTGGFDTILMHLVGVDTLPYNATSEAEESVNDVEVSLVLDVSGSMGSGTKLADMQGAAKDFLDDILAGADDDRVSVSLVPYSTQVSAGNTLLDQLTVKHNHEHSHCVNFPESSFNSTRIYQYEQLLDEFGDQVWDTDDDGNFILDENGDQIATPDYDRPISLSQTAHFDPWRSYRYGIGMRYEVCRRDANFHIDPWSNNLTNLKDQIDGFVASGNTSIDVAIKWGTALLDPSMRPILNNLIGNANYDIDAAFFPRPHDFDFDDTLKFLVVMTDGINTTQYALKDPYKEGMSPYYREGDGDILIQGQVAEDNDGVTYAEPGDRDGDSRWNEQWYSLTHRNWKNTPQAPNVQLSWLDAWAEMNMSRRAYGAYHQTSNWDANKYYDALYDPRENVEADEKDDRMEAICSAAKAEGVVVFTIGFEVTDHSANVMRACASTPNHFYRVQGLDIEYAFASIASQINQLKLTQ